MPVINRVASRNRSCGSQLCILILTLYWLYRRYRDYLDAFQLKLSVSEPLRLYTKQIYNRFAARHIISWRMWLKNLIDIVLQFSSSCQNDCRNLCLLKKPEIISWGNPYSLNIYRWINLKIYCTCMHKSNN